METAKTKQPRGLRNHNPLNIRHTSHNFWQGQVGNDGTFCLFLNNAWGYRAAFRLLHTYNRKYHAYSVREIISRWAPASDGNNTAAYIHRVCELARLKETDIIVFGSSDIQKQEDEQNLVLAVACVENGVEVKDLDMEEIRNGYHMAFRQK